MLNSSRVLQSSSARIRPLREPIGSNVYTSFIDAVGNTPLVKLQSASLRTGCNIYGKCEFMNPGGSVKDRAGVYLVRDAEDRGILQPGKPGIILEATAGNTGIGLSLAGISRGYKTIIIIPDTQSKDKKDALRASGAYLIEVPAFPFRDPRNYVHVAARLHKLLQTSTDIPVFYADQWNNQANRNGHFESTGPEILAQMKFLNQPLHAFNAAMGTGGTLVGTSMYLKEQDQTIKCVLTDPLGAMPYTYYTTGERKMGTGGSMTEGIGQGRITGNMEGFIPDEAMEIPDEEAMVEIIEAGKEGLQLGLSTGINIAGAVRLAKKLGPGHNIVTILNDSGMKYQAKQYNPTFLRSKSLPVPEWLETENSFAFDLQELLKQAQQGTETSA